MPTYVIVNRQPEGYTGSPESVAAWERWFTELGPHLVDRGNPVFNRVTIGNCGSGTVLGGYTLISAEDLESAQRLAAACPAIASGGGVEVGDLTIHNVGRRRVEGATA